MSIPVRSQALEQCKRPAKDSQVKPDAGWAGKIQNGSHTGRQSETRKQGEDKKMSGEMKEETEEEQQAEH